MWWNENYKRWGVKLQVFWQSDIWMEMKALKVGKSHFHEDSMVQTFEQRLFHLSKSEGESND